MSNGEQNRESDQPASADATANATEHAIREETPEIEIEEGGFVGELGEPGFNEPKHRALAAKTLALLFTFILAGSIVVHYTCFMILSIMERKDAVESLGRVFNVWLPALVGIVSSAAAYYFAKER